MAKDQTQGRGKSLINQFAAMCTGAQREKQPADDRDSAGDDQSFDRSIVLQGDIRLSPSDIPGATAPIIVTGSAGAKVVLDRTAPPPISKMNELFHDVWRQSAESIYEACKVAAFMRQAYASKERKLLKLPIDRTRFDKLAKAGEDERLAKITHLLPASESTICMLSRLGDDEFDEAVRTGIINPGVTRGQVAHWRGSPRHHARDHVVAAAPRIIRPKITLSPNAPEHVVQAIVREIDRLRERYGEITDITYLRK
jgi:hypothetical protein